MNAKLNSDKTVAVSMSWEWQPMETCPRGVKVQLLTEHGVAIYGVYRGGPGHLGWAPVPRRPDWMRKT
jgi:hypothetical protein